MEAPVVDPILGGESLDALDLAANVEHRYLTAMEREHPADQGNWMQDQYDHLVAIEQQRLAAMEAAEWEN